MKNYRPNDDEPAPHFEKIKSHKHQHGKHERLNKDTRARRLERIRIKEDIQ